jgi:hypothetical protein
MIFLACAGAIIASLYMLVTQGFTVLSAKRTGVLVSALCVLGWQVFAMIVTAQAA